MRTRSWMAGVLLLAACGARADLDYDAPLEPAPDDAASPDDVTRPSAVDASHLRDQASPQRNHDATDEARRDEDVVDTGVADDDTSAPPIDAAPPPPPIDAAPPPPPPIDATPPGDADTTGCDPSAPLAFLVDDDATFSLFDPTTLRATPLGRLACPAASASPFAMTVTREAMAYILYTDWNVYRVDAKTLACSTTAYSAPATSVGDVGIAVSRVDGSEDMFVLGTNGADKYLYRADLSTFAFRDVGAVTPAPPEYPLDVQADTFGRLFALGASGSLSQLDPATGRVMAQDTIPELSDGSSWALLIAGARMFAFRGRSGDVTTVTSWDLTKKQATSVATVPGHVVGASAPPCPVP